MAFNIGTVLGTLLYDSTGVSEGALRAMQREGIHDTI